MARIAGVDIPREKQAWVSLQYIYGIGPVLSRKILEQTNISPDTKVSALTEDEVKVEGVYKKLSEHNARAKAQVTSYGTYGWNNSYHEVRRPQALMNKTRKATVVSMMYKNKIDCVINGFSFATEELRVGDVVNIVFDIQDVEASQPEIDNRRSGFYLILEMSRTYIRNSHEVVISVCKIADHQKGK